MILLTGATGFLGHNLVPRLVAAGHHVRALVRPGSDFEFLRAYPVEPFLIEDLNDAATVTSACRGCWGIIHAAARFRMWGSLPAFWHDNVGATATLLAAASAAGVGRFVHISTIAVIGKPERGRVIDEDHPCYPQDHYQRTKWEAEQLVLAYQRRRRLAAIVLRPGALYGPWGHYAFNRLFFEEPLHGWRIRVNGGRHVTFPAYAPDVAAAATSALRRGEPGAIYNVSGPSLTHRAVNRIVSDLAGIPRWRLDVPVAPVLWLARAWTALARYTGREPFYPRNLAHYVFQDWPVTSARAHIDLGFRPTPFRQGAAQTLQWYAGQGKLTRRASRLPQRRGGDDDH
jgi:dihydroflavonol-4-reductase